MELNELQALISLLDDNDREVMAHVETKLKSYGTSIIPDLESAWESAFNPTLQQRIEHLIHQIQFDNLILDCKKWSESNEKKLLDGALLLARYQYADLDTSKILDSLEKIKKDIWLELNTYLTPLEQINVFNHVMYSVYKFGGSISRISDPQNFYLNNVLDSKKGNPLSLGIIYLILAEMIDMKVYGVNLPQHFILCYTKEPIQHFNSTKELQSNIIFYINPFNKGMIFTKNEIAQYLKKLQLEPDDIYFTPCNNYTIVRELFSSLKKSYTDMGSLEKAMELKILLENI